VKSEAKEALDWQATRMPLTHLAFENLGSKEFNFEIGGVGLGRGQERGGDLPSGI